MLKSPLSKLVGNKQQAATERAREPQLDPASEALLRAIEEKRKTDPLIGAKLGGKEVRRIGRIRASTGILRQG